MNLVHGVHMLFTAQVHRKW